MHEGAATFFLVQGVLFGFFCALVARRRGRNPNNWFFLGFFFSVLALIAVVVIPAGRFRRNE